MLTLKDVNKVKNISIIGSSDLTLYRLENGEQVIATYREKEAILKREKGQEIIVTSKSNFTVDQKAYFKNGKLVGFLPYN